MSRRESRTSPIYRFSLSCLLRLNLTFFPLRVLAASETSGLFSEELLLNRLIVARLGVDDALVPLRRGLKFGVARPEEDGPAEVKERPVAFSRFTKELRREDSKESSASVRNESSSNSKTLRISDLGDLGRFSFTVWFHLETEFFGLCTLRAWCRSAETKQTG